MQIHNNDDPKTLLAKIFSQLAIGNCVLIDDLAQPDIEFSNIYKLIISNSEIIQQIEPIFPNVDFKAEENIWVAQLSDDFENGSSINKHEVAKIIAANSDISDESRDLMKLGDLLPNGIIPEIISPFEWHQRKTELLEQATENKRTLFLFDQDLKIEGEGLDFKSGADIIKGLAETVPQAFGERWFCGMLSHTLNKGDEVNKWRELADTHGIKLEHFMPISKQNLTDINDFFESIYRTIINIHCEKIKNAVSLSYKNALDTAICRLYDLDPIDFEHIILKSSEKEGVSELETMIRLYSILHRDGVKQELLKKTTFDQFSNSLSFIKSVSAIHRLRPKDVRLYSLRHEELYESELLVNSHHDPLRNGDIFELNDNPENIYVLIAPPCDLMVRKDGKRSREDNFKIGIIAPITIEQDINNSKTKNSHFILPQIFSENDRFGIVEFSKATTADLQIFDLAVLNADGKCYINPEKIITKFPTRSWEKRSKNILAKKFKKVLTQIEDMLNNHGEALAKQFSDILIPRPSQSKTFITLGTYENKTFTYPIKRIGRLRDPLASMLLSAFSRFLARDAFEVDYANIEDVS
jgi:hypothetical protein